MNSVSEFHSSGRGQGRRPSLWTSVLSVVVILFLLGCMGGGEPKHPTWKNATGAEQYERLMWQAIRDKDWKQLEYRLAPTFTGVNEHGQVFDRAGWIEYWKSASIGAFSFGEVSVQPNGDNMTVSYELHLGADAGGPGLRVVSVWQQVKGGWIMIAASNTPIQAH